MHDVFIAASDIATISFDKSQYTFQENEGTVNVRVTLQPQQPLECNIIYRVISSTACKWMVYNHIFYYAIDMYM